MAALSEPAPRRRALAWILVPALALLVAGCGSSVQEGSRLTVYLDLGGGQPDVERELAEGATLALEQAGGSAADVPVELRLLPATEGGASGGAAAAADSHFRQARIAAAARTASEDSTAIAYLGESDTDGTAVSVPITNEAGILQVAIGPVAEELVREPGGNDVPGEYQTTGERTLVALAAEGPGNPPEIDPGFEADFEAAYGRPPGLAAAYGHAAMSLVLDSVEASDDPLDRLGVIDAALASGERDSALGSYSIDPAGLGTLGG